MGALFVLSKALGEDGDVFENQGGQLSGHSDPTVSTMDRSYG